MESDNLLKKWKNLFPWISFSNDKAFCEFCSLFNPLSVFSSGTPNLKKSNFEKHEESINHIEAEKAFKEKKIQTRLKVLISTEKESTQVIEKTPESFKNMRKAVSFLAMEDIALYKSPQMFSLLDECGVTLSKSYRDKHSARDLVECLAFKIEEILLKKLDKISCIGIQMDESTDISQKSVLLTYVTFMYGGKPCVQFLKCLELEDKNAQYIYNKISGYLKEKNIFNKVIAICTDGAAVMCSQKNGVAGYFKKELRSLVFFHCLAHKISLVSNDINLRFEYVRYFQSIVYELIKFFINSPKKIKILDDYQEEIYDEVLSLIRPIKIRWFSFFRAIKRIIRLWDSLYLALTELSKLEFSASNLLKEISDFKFLFFLHFFEDLYSNLDRVSKIFQHKTIDLFAIDSVLSSCKSVIETNFLQKDDICNLPSVKTLLSECIPTFGTFRSYKLNGNTSNEEFGELLEESIRISKFTFQDLESRFPNTIFFSNFQIFDIDYQQKQLGLKINKEEEEKLVKICEFLFEGTEDYKYKLQEIKRDYIVFKDLFRYYGDFTKRNPNHFYLFLTTDHKKEIENLIPLLELYFCIQSNTAECERGFSKMNIIKTKLRNSMDIETLEYLMRISTAEVDKLNEVSDEELFERWKEIKMRKSSLIYK
jgi:hypothetical protein